MLEHSAILSPYIKLPQVFKTFVLSILEWPLKKGFTVQVLPLFSFEKKRPISYLILTSVLFANPEIICFACLASVAHLSPITI